MLERKRRKDAKDHMEITFVLPADAPPGPVSVVGDFNDWRPGTHELRPRKDGMRAVTVALPKKSTHAFRYLGEGDHWFNDEGADALDGSNSLLRT
ncbi:isoamylase early set domain-containing protein [Streptomyces sp. NBC_00249]|uniref:isoamylase early set domain-containing protein n=1 Tax=Streptomyces sp. NBC_00249 TaxID=2975690 RepID=UPI002259583E|nr:isoamylase early set domain-containing protein [Streptomyces sp. NBC_00249]MCX5195394.1 isoamylase early set domain-containing protein [Streptomyces sp. NBC_00249]